MVPLGERKNIRKQDIAENHLKILALIKEKRKIKRENKKKPLSFGRQN